AARSNPVAPDRRVRTMAWNAFPVCCPSGAKPLVPFGKAEKFSGRREHGTPDHAVLPALGGDGRPFSSRPGSSRAGLIAGLCAKARPRVLAPQDVTECPRGVTAIQLCPLSQLFVGRMILT